jgi:glycosyltransferase involved in cell wall biosynthesis
MIKTNKKNKILIFSKSIEGGTGTFCIQINKLSLLLKNLDIANYILEKPPFPIKDRINFNNFIFFKGKKFYKYRFKFTITDLFVFIQDFKIFQKIINEYKPNLVLGIDHYSNTIIILTKLLFKKNFNTVLTTHINIADNIENRTDFILKFLLKLSIAKLYNKSDLLVFVSKSLKDFVIKEFNLNKNIAKTIYNGINLNNISTSPKKLSKRPIIISLARLVEQKDHFTLIDAFLILLRKFPTVKLWLISDGDEREKLEKYVKYLGINKNIKFFGWVKNKYYYLKKADLFAFSSKREGFGYVLLEAMSQGLPVISTDTPFGPREILDNGKYGILVPMKDPQAMAEAMYKLLTDEKLYQHYSKKSLERVKYFSLDKMLNEYKKVILNLLKQ